jgi:hypothetical protein
MYQDSFVSLLGSFFLEYSRYSPLANFRIILLQLIDAANRNCVTHYLAAFGARAVIVMGSQPCDGRDPGPLFFSRA